ncbi:MAG: glutathione peroxidase [Gammaproteobacteria bacterium]|nr:glutathione peroxidase [Gammaproteobacteria bacterium]MBU1556085.1 glutathione peroxidase [Gammaproteobacteria bacterium]MBU2070326.1 glutathione peroxidase [Gammaproteobacteria bacterium]MBU2182359.1 glutathione peroxidase [Gammaproteobacteria bacterium]MBU2203990.1 glutathione peroxidase [Gammaproteobacteria bacterium]
MKTWLSAAAFAATMLAMPVMAGQCGDILGHSMQQLNSRESVDLCDSYKGKTILVVNTASKCGFTKQFEGLEALYQQYQDKGLVILGFPSDSFKQEYDDAEKTAEVCYLTYGVKFPMFASSKVKGDQANPVFKALIAKTGESPSWNFNKYLVSADEQTVKHFGSRTAPDDKAFIAELEKMLAANAGAEPAAKSGE